MLGLGINFNRQATKGSSVAAFTPASLFESSEQGAWFSMDDFDALKDWRRNLLEYTDDFDVTQFLRGNVTVALGSGLKWQTLSVKATNTSPFALRSLEMLNIPCKTAEKKTFSCYIEPDGSDECALQFSSHESNGSPAIIYFQGIGTSSPSVNLSGYSSGHAHASSYSIVDVGNGLSRLSVSWDHYGTETGVKIYLTDQSAAGAAQILITPANTTDGIWVYGCQVEEGGSATDYQKISGTWKQQFVNDNGTHTVLDNGDDPVIDYGVAVKSLTSHVNGHVLAQAQASYRPTTARFPTRGKVNLVDDNLSHLMLPTPVGTSRPTFAEEDHLGGAGARAYSFGVSGTTGHYLTINDAVSTSDVVTASIWYKDADAGTSLHIIAGGGSESSSVNLVNTGSGVWYRAEVTHTMLANHTFFQVAAKKTSSGSGFATLAFLQVEQGSAATDTQIVRSPTDVTETTGAAESCLNFSGTDGMSFAFSPASSPATDALTIHVGLNATSSGKVILESSNYFDYAVGAFQLIQFGTTKTRYRTKGSPYSSISQTEIDTTLGESHVLTADSDISYAQNRLKSGSGTWGDYSTTNQGTGTYTNLPVNIGAGNAGSSPRDQLVGNIYEVIIRGVISTSTEIAKSINYINGRM
ncbi:MAG: hypothetical protein NZ730_06515 [Porticoccaceae bacterium]|nr:hypothetical protein [Porticoccaceae bacterium]